MKPRALVATLLWACRTLLLPFPAAVFVCFVGLGISDLYLSPNRVHLPLDATGNSNDLSALFLIGFGLQAVVGAPSLYMLDDKRSRMGGYLVTGSAIAFLAALFFASVLRAPAHGETFTWMFSCAFVVFGIPLIGSYIIAFLLRPLCGGETAESRS